MPAAPAAHYHLHATNGSAAKGYSAAEHYAYVAREGKYADPEQASEDLVVVISENMPAWAAEDPALYWFAADQFERDNGVLYKEIEFALPHGLDESMRIAVALEMARDRARTSDGKMLPFTLAIHAGKNGANWNAHQMISERANDGIDRTPDTWFTRAAASPRKRDKETRELMPSKKQINASKGGAKKTTELRPKTWLMETRKRWADIGNAALELAGRDERLDHRSLKDQGIDRVAQIHLGRKAIEMEKNFQKGERKHGSDRVATNNEIIQANKIMAEEELVSLSEALEAAYQEAEQIAAENRKKRVAEAQAAKKTAQQMEAAERTQNPGEYLAKNALKEQPFEVTRPEAVFLYKQLRAEGGVPDTPGVYNVASRNLCRLEVRRNHEGQLAYVLIPRAGMGEKLAGLLRRERKVKMHEPNQKVRESLGR